MNEHPAHRIRKVILQRSRDMRDSIPASRRPPRQGVADIDREGQRQSRRLRGAGLRLGKGLCDPARHLRDVRGQEAVQ
jgi:hypothetical protein